MEEKERAEPRNITLYPRQWAAVELRALDYDGNVSMALRRIVDERADMGSKQLSLDAAYDTILDVAKRIESMANRVTTNTDTRDELDGLTGRLLNAALYLDGARREVADRMRPEVTR